MKPAAGRYFRRVIPIVLFAVLPILAAFGPSAVAAPSAAAHQVHQASASAAAPAQNALPRPDVLRLSSPQSVLPAGWKSSADRAVTTNGDDNGFHVLVADEKSGYLWRTAATLSEPGFDTDQWIGQICVTSSGRRAVVVYAPRSATNDTGVFNQGAFAAIVDLVTGAVRKLPFTVSLAYYDPGCGAGETVALSSLATAGNKMTSTVRVIDAASGKVLRATVSAGQLSSPVPYAGGVAAALGHELVSIDSHGGEHVLAKARSVPFRIHPDAAGGLAYELPVGKNVQVRRFSAGKSLLIGTGPLGAIQLTRSGSRVFMVGANPGKSLLAAKLPASWQRVTAPAYSDVSTTGALAVSFASNKVNATSPAAAAAMAKQAGGIPDQIVIHALVTPTGKPVSFAVTPAALNPKAGAALSPALSGFVSVAPPSHGPGTRPGATSRNQSVIRPALDTGGNAQTETFDPDRGCAIPRNDPGILTYQATAAQVEWAADLAVNGQLTPSRGVNWENSGMPVSWTPQTMFPRQPLDGGGTVPVQVLLGVLAQESNTMQASPHAVDAVTGNYNQGGFYGNHADWSTVDCGTGIGQITTGMAMSTPSGTSVADGSPYFTTQEQQQAIATDYASNIAATLNMLIDKWNQLYNAGIIAGDGNTAYIENWYFAVWAYNAGVEPGSAAYGNTTGCQPSPSCTDNGGSGGNWGLGWANNPANPVYPDDRTPFVNSPVDTKVPNHWPYPELVMGWAYSPVPRYNYATSMWGPAYAPAVNTNYRAVLPSFMQFCTSSDNCTPDGATDTATGDANSAGLCALSNFHCWWHNSSSWVSCGSSGTCGTGVLTYTSSSAKPLGTDIYPADCRALGTASGSTSSDSTGATPPAGSVVVDDTSTPNAATCSPNWTDQGSFGINFTDDPNPCPAGETCNNPINYPGKIDFHQLGVGAGGHIWFTHTEPSSDYTDTIVGTWTPPALNGWERVYVHIPDSGDTTQQAPYTISTGSTNETRYVNTHVSTNEWVSLGVFQFNSGGPEFVSLTNITPDGDGTQDIAWDAVAFQHLSAKPANFVVQMGDSYSSGEGTGSYLPGTDVGPYASLTSQTSPGESWNACRRSSISWIRQTVLPGETQTIGALSDTNDSSLDYHSVACSNGSAGTMDPFENGNPSWGANGQFHEVQQLLSGYLDSNTTLVTLTLGGNDANWSSVVQACAKIPIGSLGCPDNSTVEGYVQNAMPKVSQVVKDIHLAAPNAKIVLLGYPDIFDANAGMDTCATDLTGDAATQLNTWGDYAEGQEAAMAAALPAADKVQFVNVEPTFVGYQDCGPIASGINDVVIGPNGPGDFSCPLPLIGTTVCISRSSFHPNAAGTARYTVALEAALG
jgi:hypothetical protein